MNRSTRNKKSDKLRQQTRVCNECDELEYKCRHRKLLSIDLDEEEDLDQYIRRNYFNTDEGHT